MRQDTSHTFGDEFNKCRNTQVYIFCCCVNTFYLTYICKPTRSYARVSARLSAPRCNRSREKRWKIDRLTRHAAEHYNYYQRLVWRRMRKFLAPASSTLCASSPARVPTVKSENTRICAHRARFVRCVEKFLRSIVKSTRSIPRYTNCENENSCWNVNGISATRRLRLVLIINCDSHAERDFYIFFSDIRAYVYMQIIQINTSIRNIFSS